MKFFDGMMQEIKQMKSEHSEWIPQLYNDIHDYIKIILDSNKITDYILLQYKNYKFLCATFFNITIDHGGFRG